MTIEMTASEMIDLLVKSATIPDIYKNEAICYIGPPGVGKDWLALEAVSQLRRKTGKKWNYYLIQIGQQQPGEDIIPVPGENGAFQLQTSEWWTQIKEPALIVLGEITTAHKAVISEKRNLFTPIGDVRRVGNITLPDQVLIYANGNPPGHGGGVYSHLYDPADRIRWQHFTVPNSRERLAGDWIENFAVPNDVAVELIGFIKQYPDWIYGIDVEDEENTNKNLSQLIPSDPLEPFPNPRSLTGVSRYIKHREAFGDDLFKKAVRAKAGEHLLTALYEYLANNILPNPEDILSGRETVSEDLATQTQTAILVTRHVVQNGKKAEIDQFLNLTTDWYPEAVASAWPVIKKQDIDWVMEMEVFETINSNPRWVEKHWKIKEDVERLWKGD
jgi:hypothetical protein